jgi:hypothetical protein
MSETVLITPKGYDRDKKCNGCGSGWNSKLVPDRIYLLNITRACCIHDYMYEVGTTTADKKVADSIFLINLKRLIDEDKNFIRNNRFMKRRMKNIAKVYYDFVDKFGDDAYWEGKKK